jgi:hypothetical protein
VIFGGGAIDERPMRDLGRLAVILMAPFIALFMSWGEPAEKRTCAAEIRADARARPRTALEAMAANILRAGAWFYLMFGALALLIVGQLVDAYGPRPLGPLAEAATPVSIYLAMFAGGALLVTVAHISVASSIGRRAFPPTAHRRPGNGRSVVDQRGPGAFVRWAATPSRLDALPALWFAVAFGGALLG